MLTRCSSTFHVVWSRSEASFPFLEREESRSLLLPLLEPAARIRARPWPFPSPYNKSHRIFQTRHPWVVIEEDMGLCLSTAGVCIKSADEAVNEFLDRQSIFYDESRRANERLEKKSNGGGGDNNNSSHHLNAVLQSGLSPIHPSLPISATKHRCRNVYDGDTLTLEDDARVRLVGIDTPELKERQPFALEAKEYTKKYCNGKDVWLTFVEIEGRDDEKNKDHYGRLLAFVWVPLADECHGIGGGTTKSPPRKSASNPCQWLCINEGLVASGLAHAYSPSNSKRVHNHDKLLGLQRLARVNKRGQWATFKDYDIIVTPNGGAFHKCKMKKSTINDCKHLSRSRNLSLLMASDAYDKGMHPCRNCLG